MFVRDGGGGVRRPESATVRRGGRAGVETVKRIVRRTAVVVSFVNHGKGGFGRVVPRRRRLLLLSFGLRLVQQRRPVGEISRRPPGSVDGLFGNVVRGVVVVLRRKGRSVDSALEGVRGAH